MEQFGADVRDWLNAFWRVLLLPRSQTYVELGEVADGKWKGLVAWLVGVAVCSFALANALVPGGMLPSTLFILIMFYPIGVLMWIMLIHLGYQKLFGRKKDKHAELLYVLGSIVVVTAMGNLVIGQIPVIGNALSYLELLYGAVVVVLATRAITRLDLWRVIAAVTLATLGTVVLVALLALFLAGLTSTNSQLFRP